VSKRFGSVAALTGVDADFHGGEVHAVLGENGAGKSTLMNAAYGLTHIDAGEVHLRGAPVRFRGTLDARRAGIGMVHQEFSLVNALTVRENLTLCLTPAHHLLWDREGVDRAARRLADALGLELPDLDAPVAREPVGVRQRIEILKALAGKTDVLILDEPTAVLTPAETAQLFAVLGRLRAQGAAVALVTHRLGEVMAIADRVTVMRRGRVVARRERHELNEAELARLMVGELPPRPGRARRPGRGEEPAPLRLRGLSARGARTLERVDLEVGPGEILGIAGVDGNGQSELFEVLVGLRRPQSGAVEIAGTPVTRFEPAAMTAAGIGHIPPDRLRQGAVASMSVAENLVLDAVLLRRLARGPFLGPEPCRRIARDLVDAYDIRAASLDAPAESLSGGNLQRLIVARALSLEPRVLVAFNPTRGLDIAATGAVHAAIDAAAARGAAALLISTDLDEVLAVSDRLAVLTRGRLSAPMEPPFSLERVALLMASANG
jgi:simple sugar transport system ATP-binding protein